MKRYLLRPFAALQVWPLLVLALLSACSPQAAAPPRNVKVLGFGSVTSYPDLAEITVESSFTKPAMRDAVQEMKLVTEEVLALSRQFTSKPEDIRISSVSANKEYQYLRDQQKFIGYNTSQSITIKLTNLKRLESFMEGLLKTRINRIQHIRYSHTQADSLQREADLLALKEASKTADQLCRTSNVSKGQLLEMANYNSRGRSMVGDAVMAEETNMRLEAKGIGTTGLRMTPDLIIFSSTCHATYGID
ncbi:SIMPL domain-containing protein [Rufibacter roseolus]|uniref:SIMPL domain-containing protein n=1 Tax=Rufibacter roseolus TaxID=2817375 RepID=UPI001B3042C4|nr:SIMPL domain-containing protein [Rufibacter roseolus]